MNFEHKLSLWLNICNRFFIVSIVLCLMAIYQSVHGQTLPVGFPAMEDYLRRMQLVGELDSNVSMTIRPLNPKEVFKWNYSYFNEKHNDSLRSNQQTKKRSLSFSPVILESHGNSHHPTIANMGSMIPNKGLQTRLITGLYFKHRKISVQLMPEYIRASNLYFEEFTTDHFEVVWGWMYKWWNQIDTPVRFGESTYTRLMPGQSSIRFNHKELSVGISTENLWWGPGKRNALLMSNNASGFMHFTVNTNQPFRTPFGFLEGQFIAGRLDESGYNPPDTASRIYYLSNLYHPKRESWRYLSGLTFSLQPKWVPGLFVGYSRVSQVYHDEINRITDVIPFFNGRNKYSLDADIVRTTNQQFSAVFFRFLLKESKAELYAEYGTNGNSRSLRDFIERPNLHRAFTVGMSKIYSLKKRGAIQIDIETTQMGQVVRSVIRDANSWYTHPHIRHGYTHRGQVIGAAIGPGSNVQYVGVSWFNGFNRIGVFGERLVHNNDFFYHAFERSTDWRRFWTDLSTGVVLDCKFNNFIISSNFRLTKSLNYQWYLKQEPGESYFVKGRDVLNWNGTVSIAYLLR